MINARIIREVEFALEDQSGNETLRQAEGIGFIAPNDTLLVGMS